jgi:hypothetical protein
MSVANVGVFAKPRSEGGMNASTVAVLFGLLDKPIDFFSE